MKSNLDCSGAGQTCNPHIALNLTVRCLFIRSPEAAEIGQPERKIQCSTRWAQKTEAHRVIGGWIPSDLGAAVAWTRGSATPVARLGHVIVVSQSQPGSWFKRRWGREHARRSTLRRPNTARDRSDRHEPENRYTSGRLRCHPAFDLCATWQLHGEPNPEPYLTVSLCWRQKTEGQIAAIPVRDALHCAVSAHTPRRVTPTRNSICSRFTCRERDDHTLFHRLKVPVHRN